MNPNQQIHRLTDIIVEEVSLVDRAANKRKFLVVKREEQAKAEWTTAYVNDLPDSAFLHVSEGGEKDQTNRTVPRSLRHFPVRDASGSIDLPHLRNAIARIPQSNLPMTTKEQLQATARRMLEEATTKETEKMSTELTPDGEGGFTTAAGAVEAEKGYGMMGDKKKKPMMKFDLPPGSKALLVPMLQRAAEQLQMLADETDKSTEVPLPDDGMLPPVPAEFWSSLMGVAKILAQLDGMFPNKPAMAPEIEVEEPEAEEMMGESPAGAPSSTEMQQKSIKDVVAKVGSKMSKERLGRFEAALQTLASILTELRPSDVQPAQVSEVTARAPSKKMEDTVERLAQAVGSLAGAVKSQGAELASLKKSRATGNALAPEVGSARGDDMVSWPLDMNSPITRDVVGKGESFFDE